ncbi:MAG: hypothetical protein GY699_09465 [Desulfobacteraceae bacterium]|nr:hypothetical protein [Desulfobacteraceae bacterium]
MKIKRPGQNALHILEKLKLITDNYGGEHKEAHVAVFKMDETIKDLSKENEELEQINQNNLELFKIKDNIIRGLRRNSEKLRECVEFYADKDNWGSDSKSLHDGFSCFDIILYDFSQSDTELMRKYGGKLARQTLKELEKK